MIVSNDYSFSVSDLRNAGVVMLDLDEYVEKIKEVVADIEQINDNAESVSSVMVACFLMLLVQFGGFIPRRFVEFLPDRHFGHSNVLKIVLSNLINQHDREDRWIIGFGVLDIYTESVYGVITEQCITDPVISIEDVLITFNTQLSELKKLPSEGCQLMIYNYQNFVYFVEDEEIFLHDTKVIFKATLNRISEMDVVDIISKNCKSANDRDNCGAYGTIIRCNCRLIIDHFETH